MKEVDKYSYHCGVIHCFNEMIQIGIKKLALSHPLSKKGKQELLPFVKHICGVHNTSYYEESTLLQSALFESEASVYIFYQDENVLQEYIKLKQVVNEYCAKGIYTQDKRKAIARSFGKLLSYPNDVIEKMIDDSLNAKKSKA